VASGNACIASINFDNQAALSIEHFALEKDHGNRITNVARYNDTLFALSAPTPSADPPERDCSSAVGKVGSGAVLGLNYASDGDPVLYGKISQSLAGATSLQRYGDWLLAAGVRKGVQWKLGPACRFLLPSLTVNAVTAGGEHAQNVDAVTMINLFDPVLTRQYDFDAYVADSLIYGDYLIVALGDQGIEIRHLERPEITRRMSFDGIIENPGKITRLQLLGSSLILSAYSGGLILLDLADPLNPEILSAGNREVIHATDLFKDRLIAASGKPSISVMQLTD
jgi:hypothetical protein